MRALIPSSHAIPQLRPNSVLGRDCIISNSAAAAYYSEDMGRKSQDFSANPRPWNVWFNRRLTRYTECWHRVSGVSVGIYLQTCGVVYQEVEKQLSGRRAEEIREGKEAGGRGIVFLIPSSPTLPPRKGVPRPLRGKGARGGDVLSPHPSLPPLRGTAVPKGEGPEEWPFRPTIKTVYRRRIRRSRRTCRRRPGRGCGRRRSSVRRCPG